MSQTWFTSDVHLGHANIIQYSERPFDSVDDMNSRIVEGWNQQVGPDDTVFIIGDLCMGKLDDSLAVAGQLQGHKHLLPGNHDRCHPGFVGKKFDVAHWRKRYAEGAGIEVFLNLQPRISVGNHRSVQFCHFPYTGDHVGEEDRYVELRPQDKGERLVHGHVHDAWIQNGRMINVGLDAHGGKILSEDELEALLDREVQWQDRIPWPANYPEG